MKQYDNYTMIIILTLYYNINTQLNALSSQFFVFCARFESVCQL